MKPENQDIIPIPLKRRWDVLRMAVFPGATFAIAVIVLAVMWSHHVASPSLVGQAEPRTAQVNYSKTGTLLELHVTRFQKVKAGDPIGTLMVADPAVLENSLGVIRREIDLLRTGNKPVSDRQRTAMDYGQLRLDWMRQRAALASAKVNLQLAQTEWRRTEELYRENITSKKAVDKARASLENAQSQVEELSRLVAEGEKLFKNLQPGSTADLQKIGDDPLRAAIAVQESKLRLTEAELKPVILTAPMDGTVAQLNYIPGESIPAGTSIACIAAQNSTRIVAYLRPSLIDGTSTGTSVEIRKRNGHRERGMAKITDVGSQMETIPLVFHGGLKPLFEEQGLPINISMPSNLALIPGEVVDIFVSSRKE